MSAPAPSSASPSAPTTADLDASCRWPVLLLFQSAAGWLTLGLLLAVVASIQLHAPQFLAHCPVLTYGRVRPAFLDVLVYGFASQAGLGVALWLLCRLGRTALVNGLFILLGTVVWNVGVAVGLYGILAGDNTGYEWLEMSRAANKILFAAYAVIGGSALLTFRARRASSLYPSQWYLLAALFGFPWVFSIGHALLIGSPVRGVMQAVVSGWYASALQQLWLAPLGLAAIFYLLPKLANRPLASRPLAAYGFWLLVFLGGWGGLTAGLPVPRWITAASTLGSVLLIVPVLAVATNLRQTLASQSLKQNAPLLLVVCGAIAYVLGGVLTSVSALPAVASIVRFTLFHSALLYLLLFGFLGLTFAGAVYHIVPRLTQQDWPSTGLVKLHLTTSLLGLSLATIALALGGVLQGAALADATRGFLESVQLTQPFLKAATFGLLLLLLGQFAFLGNALWLVARCCGQCCQLCANWTTEARPATAGGAR